MARYIEGNLDFPVNRGVLCAKGSAGIMQHHSPARPRAPLKRVGPRGSGEFQEITWDEALETATGWLAAVRREDPRKPDFFTERGQSQSLTSWWAQEYGTPNYAAHGGSCSVNMAAAGTYTLGGASWGFGATDWDRATNKELPVDAPALKPELKGDFPAPDGGCATPLFELLARGFLEPDHASDTVASRCGISAERIRLIAAESADTAFAQEAFTEQSCVDFGGHHHERFAGHPVSVHAMRGISTHSNGFQTCRELHVLQLLLGSVVVPGAFRFKPPYQKLVEAHPTPHCHARPDRPLHGACLGFKRSHADLAITEDGSPARIERARAGAEVSESRLGREGSPVGPGPEIFSCGEGW